MNEINNYQKYENYKEQTTRLKKAIELNFYLEAIFIEYAIIEDRFESALRHSNIINKEKHLTLNSKLNKMESIAMEKKHPAHALFTTELIENVRLWKEERNRLIHALMKQLLTTEELKSLAVHGHALVKNLCSITTSYSRKMDKLNLYNM